ncbi:hypothetical protein JHK85_050739 [Glycine max]|uniref:CCHC-type domain-containing protein n=1 Tax=Glycine max TaxID=3847 RepID=A0A0R0EZE0_SOYBN|nr:hypothetical protein JHK86_049966 [Glycine max]KAG4935820.1 hypothetical protein JHK85_050739 [Glycine max]
MMIAHFKYTHIDLWDFVDNGNHIPYDVELNEIHGSQWTEEQKQIFMLNSKALDVLSCALSEEVYTKVLEELVGTLKVHEQELQQDEGTKKGKYLALNAYKLKKVPLSKEFSSRPSSKSVSKALSMDNSSNKEFEEESNEDDELALISRKIRKMWKNKSRSKWKNSSKKSSIICYECKKPRHFKSECLKLEKSKDKYKHYMSKDKKGLMSTWENLDDTTFDEEGEEEAKLCLMAYTTYEESESKQNEINLNYHESLKKTYHKLFLSLSIISKAYKNLQKSLRNCPKITIN